MLRLCGLADRRFESRGEDEEARRAIAVVVTTFAGFVGAATANHSWGSYHWARTSNPFTLKLDNNVTTAWTPTSPPPLLTGLPPPCSTRAIITAIGLSEHAVSPAPAGSRSATATYGNNGWLGVARSRSAATHHPAHGQAQRHLLQHSDLQHAPWRQPRHVPRGRPHVGLDHQDVNFDQHEPRDLHGLHQHTGPRTSTRTRTTTTSCRPSTAHLDSTTTVGASAGFLPDACPVSPSPPANQVNRSTYRTDLGDGHALVTHIFWIDSHLSPVRAARWGGPAPPLRHQPWTVDDTTKTSPSTDPSTLTFSPVPCVNLSLQRERGLPAGLVGVRRVARADERAPSPVPYQPAGDRERRIRIGSDRLGHRQAAAWEPPHRTRAIHRSGPTASRHPRNPRAQAHRRRRRRRRQVASACASENHSCPPRGKSYGIGRSAPLSIATRPCRFPYVRTRDLDGALAPVGLNLA